MGRPREFSVETALASARDLFWERGFAGATLDGLEETMKLSRSSLYHAFGTKEALFTEALALYVDGFVAGWLGPMESPTGSRRDVVRFFRTLARRFRHDIGAQNGCLWVNSIVEFSGRGDGEELARASEYRKRLTAAFTNALRTDAVARNGQQLGSLARRLMLSTVGVWVEARLDPVEAARSCDALARWLMSGGE
jgi:AcrR family transcriptional regulator